MSSIMGIIIITYIIRSLYRHFAKHWNSDNYSSSSKNISYREDGSIESAYRSHFLGYASKYYYRRDGSVWKKESYYLKSLIEDNYTLYYPSGRVKYEVG